MWDADKKDWEKVDGKEVLRILEFSVADGKWTGRHWKYPLELAGNNIGDFNMIDATTGLVIERDNGEGTADRACPEEKPADCFNVPARFRRIYKIEMSDANAGSLVRKIGYIDLMDIDDPRKLARQGGKDGKLTFPFVTIEDVDIVNATQIIVANDNNFPYSAGREPQKQDDNEFILLDVADFLKASDREGGGGSRSSKRAPWVAEVVPPRGHLRNRGRPRRGTRPRRSPPPGQWRRPPPSAARGTRASSAMANRRCAAVASADAACRPVCSAGASPSNQARFASSSATPWKCDVRLRCGWVLVQPKFTVLVSGFSCASTSCVSTARTRSFTSITIGVKPTAASTFW